MAQGKQRDDDAERVSAHHVAVAVHVPPHMYPSAVRGSHIEAAVRQLEEVPRTALVGTRKASGPVVHQRLAPKVLRAQVVRKEIQAQLIDHDCRRDSGFIINHGYLRKWAAAECRATLLY